MYVVCIIVYVYVYVYVCTTYTTTASYIFVFDSYTTTRRDGERETRAGVDIGCEYDFVSSVPLIPYHICMYNVHCIQCQSESGKSIWRKTVRSSVVICRRILMSLLTYIGA